jgi:hypothetical protein
VQISKPVPCTTAPALRPQDQRPEGVPVSRMSLPPWPCSKFFCDVTAPRAHSGPAAGKAAGVAAPNGRRPGRQLGGPHRPALEVGVRTRGGLYLVRRPKRACLHGAFAGHPPRATHTPEGRQPAFGTPRTEEGRRVCFAVWLPLYANPGQQRTAPPDWQRGLPVTHWRWSPGWAGTLVSWPTSGRRREG